MPQQIHQHTFGNGLTLLAERIEHVRSATLYFLIPAGAAYDPPDRLGTGTLLGELLLRGAGNRDKLELTLALDSLGLDRGERVATIHTSLSAVTLASNLAPALDLYADILRRPHLPEEELEPAKLLAEQEIQGLEDEPGARVMVELHRHIYPRPLSNDHRGTLEGIRATSIEDIRRHHRALFRPRGTILGVAGYIDWESLREQVGQLFGDWEGGEAPALQFGPEPPARGHVSKEVEQTHIALAYPSVPIGHEDYYRALGAVNVLSGGMGSRLFTEVREKEGLAYAVSARYRTLKERANVVCYIGSDKPQRALDVLMRELNKLPEGVTEEEVQRVKVGLETSLLMQQDSTGARASSLASDWYHLGRVRSLDEIQTAVDGLSATTITEHVRRLPPKDFRLVTLGPHELTF